MSLRHTLLALLDWSPLHGYALREAARSYAWLYPMSNTNIYPTLASLESDDCVSHREEVVDGRLRKVYSVTDAGREELCRWLADPGPEATIMRDSSLLKVCFLREGSLQASLAWVRRDLDVVTREMEQAEKLMDAIGDRIPKYNRMVGDYGLAMARMRKEFLTRVIEEIAADAATGCEAGATGTPRSTASS